MFKFLINGKLIPCVERTIIVHFRYEKSEFVDDRLIVCMNYTSM